MANINQGAPGSVDKPGAQKEVISDALHTHSGEAVRVLLFSDGSREVWINGVLDHVVPVLSDLEKTVEEAVDTAEVTVEETVDAVEETVEETVDEVEAAVEEETPEVESFVEHVVDVVEEKVEEVVDEVEDLAFKTVAELRELADKLGVDLGKSTKKDDIIEKIQPSE